MCLSCSRTSIFYLEANALIAEGNTDLAAETLQKALENQRLAVERADHTDALANLEVSFNASRVNEDEDKEEDKEKDEFSGLLKQNIASLILAMDKVDNPRAQAALSKNIEKSFGKLITKAAKRNYAEIDNTLQGQTAALDDVLQSSQISDEKKSVEALTEIEEQAEKQATEKSEEFKNTTKKQHGKSTKNKEHKNKEQKNKK